MDLQEAERTAEAAKRRNTFDFIRLVAALAVVVEHAVHHLDAPFLWHRPGDDLWFNGGVATFFILSGMMVYKSAERCVGDRRPWSDFYQNRALRIVPAIYAYFVALVILLLIMRFLAPAELVTVPFAAFAASNLLLIPVWSPPMLTDFGIGVVNGSLWTIPVEVSFYLVVPLLAVLAFRVGWRTMVLATLLVAAGGVVLYGVVGATASPSMAWKLYGVTFVPYLWWFAIGIFWSRAWARVPHRGWLAAVALVLYFVLAKLPLDTGPAFLANAAAAIPLSYAAIWFGYHGPQVLGRLTARVGDLSFSVYIWHMIVVNVLVSWSARSWQIDGTILVLGVIVVTMAISWLSWHLVERPALNRKRYTSANTVAAEPAEQAAGAPPRFPANAPNEPRGPVRFNGGDDGHS